MAAIDPSLLSSLAHPCIGACIGFLTSMIAIRMLFRPLRPWYLFGFKLPMTPGVIPLRRHALAMTIGEMVGHQLLSSKDISAAILTEPFQEHLAGQVDRTIQEIFKKDLGPLAEIIPERFKAYFQVGVKTMKYQLGEAVHGYLAGSGFEEKITASILSHLDDLAEHDLNSLLSPANRQPFYCLVNGVITDLLISGTTEEWLAEHLSSSLRRTAAQGGTIGDLFPEQLITLLKSFIREHSSPFLLRTGTRLSDPILREQVVKGLQGSIDHFLDSLGPAGAVASSFLEMGALEKKVDAYLEGREEDLVTWLQNPEVQNRMALVSIENIDSLLHRKLAPLLAGIGDEHLGRICRACTAQLLAVFRIEGTLTGLSALFHVGMEASFDSGQRTLGALAGQVFYGNNGLDIRQTIVRECLALLRSNKTERWVHSMVHSMVDVLLTRPVGRLHNIVPHGVRQGITEYGILTVNRILLQEVPKIVESLNVKQVVIDTVDALDLQQMERLLHSIMEERLKYIYLFGALLGFLLGLSNLALVNLL